MAQSTCKFHVESAAVGDFVDNDVPAWMSVGGELSAFHPDEVAELVHGIFCLGVAVFSVVDLGNVGIRSLLIALSNGSAASFPRDVVESVLEGLGLGLALVLVPMGMLDHYALIDPSLIFRLL